VGQPEHRGDVQLHLGLHGIPRDLREVAADLEAGAVDEHVDRRLGEPVLDQHAPGGLRQVCDDHRHRHAVAMAEAVRSMVQPLRVASDQDQIVSVGTEALGEGGADSGTSARDQSCSHPFRLQPFEFDAPFGGSPCEILRLHTAIVLRLRI
jgi:hypothetical protein